MTFPRYKYYPPPPILCSPPGTKLKLVSPNHTISHIFVISTFLFLPPKTPQKFPNYEPTLFIFASDHDISQSLNVDQTPITVYPPTHPRFLTANQQFPIFCQNLFTFLFKNSQNSPSKSSKLSKSNKLGKLRILAKS